MSIGGHTVTSLAVNLGADKLGLLYASTHHGVFQSRQRAGAWQTPEPIDGEVGFTAICIARDASEYCLFGGNAWGLFRRSRAGTAWEHVLSETVVNTVIASTQAIGTTMLLVGTEHDGVLVSTDLGASFQSANAGLLDLSVISATFSPGFSDDQMVFVGTLSGVYRSRNGAKSWSLLEIPTDESVIQCIACAPQFLRDRVVLIGSESDGLFRSGDGGTTWNAIESQHEISISDIAFVSSSGDEVILAANEHLLRSLDAGRTWERLQRLPHPVMCLATFGSGPTPTLFAGLLEGGIGFSRDLGTSWEFDW